MVGSTLQVVEHWRVHRLVTSRAGDLLTTEPYKGLGLVAGHLQYPGAAEDFVSALNENAGSAVRPYFLLHRQDALALAVSRVLLEDPGRARELVRQTAELCRNQAYGALCAAIHGFEPALENEETEAPSQCSEDEYKEPSDKDLKDTFSKGICLAKKLRRAIETGQSEACACSASDCPEWQACEVSWSETEPDKCDNEDEGGAEGSDGEEVIKFGYQVKLAQISLRRLTCNSVKKPHKDALRPLEGGVPGHAGIDGDLKVETRIALDFAYAVKGPGRTGAIRDVAADPTGSGEARNLAGALLKIARMAAPDASGPAALSQILNRSRGEGLQELWELAFFSKTNEHDEELLIGAARGLLKAPLALDDSDWLTAAEDGAFIAAAKLALKDHSRLRRMVSEGGCGFHCLAGLAGAVCGKPVNGPLLKLERLASTSDVLGQSSPCAELLSKRISPDPKAKSQKGKK